MQERDVVISFVKKDENRVALKDAANVWYSTFAPKDPDPEQAEAWDLLKSLERGDKVKIYYSVNDRGFNAIGGIEKLGHEDLPSGKPGGGWRGRGQGRTEGEEKRIVKQACLKAAAEFHSGQAGVNGMIANDVLEDAKYFFAWVYEAEK